MNTQEHDFRQGLLATLPALRRYCFALTNNRHDADDLLQASVEKALSRWQQFEPGTRLDRWMYRLCRNHWIDTMRTLTPTDEFVEETMGQDVTPNTEQQVLSRIALQQVQEQISRLSEGLRLVLYLVAVEGCSYQEAADILDIPAGTVMSRLARARAQLADALD